MFIIPSLNKIIRRDALFLQIVPATVVFVVLCTFAVISWQGAESTLEAQRTQMITERATLIEDAINQRMQTSELLLRSGSGLFEASETVTRDEWMRYFQNFNTQEQLIGVTAIGYAPTVNQADKAAFEATQQTAGLAGYSISPSGERAVYAPTLYLEQYGQGSVKPGFDMYSEPIRRAAMEEARDSGKLAMTKLVSFSSDNTPGVIIYLPVYTIGMPTNSVEQRRTALRGYVFEALSTDKLFAGIATGRNTEFAVTEESDFRTSRLYDSMSENGTPTDLSTIKPVNETVTNIFGQEWHIHLFSTGDIVSETDNERPSTILTAGIAIAFIVSVAVYLLIQYRTRNFALGEERKLQAAKNELLSLASHQLRTPATGVKQYVGMVLEGFAGKLSKDQISLLEQAYKSNERQLQIINEFLYVAKLGSGSLTTSKHAFDLVPVVRDVVDEMALEIKERHHKVRLKTPKDAKLTADEHSVRMIIENLLSNAIKYTKPGGMIRVTLTKASGEWRVHVQDNGIGIDKNDTSLLFKQFSRIPNELSIEVSGSGIGLYLAQQLAHRNGGHISVESEPGIGSLFTLHLPAKSVRNITPYRKRT